jgi:hypothetical protein
MVYAVVSIQMTWALGAAIKPRATESDYKLKPISLPGATGAVALDYFAYDRATGKLWVPASNTGSVDVIDEKTDAVRQVTGFQTGEIERRGRKIMVGPTAAMRPFASSTRRPSRAASVCRSRNLTPP